MKISWNITTLLLISLTTQAVRIEFKNFSNAPASLKIFHNSIYNNVDKIVTDVVIEDSATHIINFKLSKDYSFLNMVVNRDNRNFLFSNKDTIAVNYYGKDSVAFVGSGYQKYSFITTVENMINDLLFPSLGKTIHDLDHDAYVLRMEAITKNLVEVTSQFLPLFTTLEQEILKDYCFYRILSFNQNRQEAYYSFWENEYKNTPIYLQNLEMSVKNNLHLFNAGLPDYLYCLQYKTSIVVQNNWHNKEYSQFDGYERTANIVFKKIDEMGLDKKICEYILAYQLRDLLNNNFLNSFVEYHNYFNTRFLNSPFDELISSGLKTAQSLSQGESPPEFTFFDIDDSKIEFSDFKDKVVYVDFWAT